MWSGRKPPKKPQLRKRDEALLVFLEKSRTLMTTELAARYFYDQPETEKGRINAARSRMKLLADHGWLKREQDYANQPATFAHATCPIPKKKDHKLLVAETLLRFMERFKVLEYTTEWTGLLGDYNLRTDIYLLFLAEINSKPVEVAAWIECENSKKFTKGEAYTRLFADMKRRRYKGKPHPKDYLYQAPHFLISVADKNHPVPTFWIKKGFGNFEEVCEGIIEKLRGK